MVKAKLETEIKLRIEDPEGTRARLLALDFEEVLPAAPETSVLWDRDGALCAEGSALRLRSHGPSHTLTWKGARLPDPIFKIRPEAETALDDPSAMEAILTALGYRPVMRMEKLRAVLEGRGLVACVDRASFGDFLELEGPVEAIRAVMESLGVSHEQVEPRSYPTLFRAHELGAK